MTTLNPTMPVTLDRRVAAPGPPILAAGAIVLAAWYLQSTVGWRQAALFFVGIWAGLALYHASFGFTSSWRVFISDRRGAGLRAQMLMLAITCAVFFPLLASGTAFGQPVRGAVSPIGVSVLAGAFMFGIGMQLGGGCASGTLYTVGGGNTRMLVTLGGFIAGSVIGTAHQPWWTTTPAFTPTSLVNALGPWWVGLAASLALFAGIAWLTRVMERRRHGRLEDEEPIEVEQALQSVTSVASVKPLRFVGSTWPLATGAVALAAVNISTMLIAGRTWGVTSAFALWGAKAYRAVGGDIATWAYWSTPAQSAALNASVTTDVTSVMNVGIMLGALLSAMLAGRFAPSWTTTGRSVVAALVGGLLLGYGARIAYGCNIGAFFSGISSGSLHGWLWLVAAFAGNTVGTMFRPFFGLKVERTPSAC